jgi:beta-xylosidase
MWQDKYQVEFNLVNGGGYKNVEFNGVQGDMFKLLIVRPTVYLLDKTLTLSAYGSFESRNDSSNAMIFSGFAGYEFKKMVKVGVEYSMRSISKGYVNTSGVQDLKSSIVSAWAVVKATDKLSVLGLFNMYDPNTDVDKDGSSWIVAGVDFHPIKNVRFIPNVQIQTFQADDVPATTTIDESKPINTAFVTFEYTW